MDDEPEDQIKKKKRLVLLLLLALLAVTAGAAALTEPTPSTSIAALATSPSPPTTNTFTATPQIQGDEWLQPTLLSDPLQTAAATVVTAENDNEASSTNPDESDASTAVAPIEESEPVINSDEVTLIPTEISRRINESWNVLDGSYSSTAEAEDASPTLAATATLSETMVVIPPEGLPVTGAISRRGMNWAAVGVIVLLLGVGVTALLYPRPGHR